MIKRFTIVFIISLAHVNVGFADDATVTKSSNEIAPQQAVPSSKTTTTTTMQQNMAADERSGYSHGSVSRSIFTTQIADREPIDNVKKIANSERKVYYFTELRDMSGQTAIHRWEFKGKVMAETEFNVRGPRWRVWSSKNFVEGWTGEWKVSVINSAGEVISEDIFNYIEDSGSTQQTTPAINEPSSTDTHKTIP